jgi:hypothetical protein
MSSYAQKPNKLLFVVLIFQKTFALTFRDQVNLKRLLALGYLNFLGDAMFQLNQLWNFLLYFFVALKHGV